MASSVLGEMVFPSGETIGGDDVLNYAKFQLTKDATITLTIRDAIAQIINSKGMVVGDSHAGLQLNNYCNSQTRNLLLGLQHRKLNRINFYF